MKHPETFMMPLFAKNTLNLPGASAILRLACEIISRGKGQQFEYAFDDIGNRTSTKAGGDENGVALRAASYTANTLNQYTSRDVPGYVDIMGAAFTTNTVSVNGQTPYRHGEYFRKELPVNNGSAAQWTNITVTSPGQTTVSGNVFVPKTAEVFGYDLDGNMTNDGRWVFTWDAENRLTQVESVASSPTASKRKVIWEFDGKGRRIRQTSYDGSGGSYVVLEDLKFLADGWRHIAELNATNNAVVRSYAWGLDSSGSLDGAGGIGGLLMMDSAANGHHCYAYDGCGDVSALVSGVDGTVSGSYEYDVFGRVLRVSGSAGRENVFRFSTQRMDERSDADLYDYRPYNPIHGRFLTRDLLKEWTGWNLYAFVENRPQGRIDPHGLASKEIKGPTAAIFSWIAPFDIPQDEEEWAPFYEAYTRSTGNPVGDNALLIQTAVNELAISANFPAPGALYNSTTKETRGRLKIQVSLTCNDAKAVGRSVSILGANPGYTPIRGRPGQPTSIYVAAEGPKPEVRWLRDVGGSCITVSVLHKSRLGKAGQALSVLLAQTGVPWIAREIEYTLCCDCTYRVQYNGTHFPSHVAYLNDIQVPKGRWEQTDLPGFMFLGDKVLAPMRVIGAYPPTPR